jgi:hypothetical protein
VFPGGKEFLMMKPRQAENIAAVADSAIFDA